MVHKKIGDNKISNKARKFLKAYVNNSNYSYVPNSKCELYKIDNHEQKYSDNQNYIKWKKMEIETIYKMKELPLSMAVDFYKIMESIVFINKV